MLYFAARPSNWPCTVRNVLARQIYFTGIQALTIVAIMGLTVGISVVTQAGVWLSKVNQTDLFGPLISTVIIQNLGPLLVNFVVIGRSGTAIATELANMVINREVKLLDSQGIDPFVYLVAPRVLGTAIAVLSLTLVFIALALTGGYSFGVLFDIAAVRNVPFIQSVFSPIQPLDWLSFMAKTLIPSFATAAICCVEGLSAKPVITAVPQAGTRAVVRSMGTLFVISGLISLLQAL